MWPWRNRSDADFAEEIQDHIRRETKRLVDDDGLNFIDAKAKALRSFGNLTTAQERFYESRRLVWFADLRRDLNYAVRSLRKSPGFAATAIVTLALGIGATTAIYSVVDTILLQPLPFAHSDRLVRVVENEVVGLSGRVSQRGVSFQEWRARSTALTDLIAVAGSTPTLVGTDDGTKRLWGARVSANAFAILGVNAMIGRTLLSGDDRDPNVVVLGFEAWKRLFRSDPNVVGRHLELRGNAYNRLSRLSASSLPGSNFRPDRWTITDRSIHPALRRRHWSSVGFATVCRSVQRWMKPISLARPFAPRDQSMLVPFRCPDSKCSG